MGDAETNKLEIMLARMEERQKADAEAATHYRNNMRQVMGEIVPRREIKMMHEALEQKIDNTTDAIIVRVVRLEDAVEAARSLAAESARAAAIKSGGIGAGIGTTAMAVFYAAGKKLGLL